jgi:hypothetical protein
MIYRVQKVLTDSITIHKYPILDDTRLSWRAKGILTYLVGHGDGWECSEQDLMAHATEGRDATRAALRELKQYGYFRKFAVRDDGGRVQEWKTAVVEVPKDHPLYGAFLQALTQTYPPHNQWTGSQESGYMDTPVDGKSGIWSSRENALKPDESSRLLKNQKVENPTQRNTDIRIRRSELKNNTESEEKKKEHSSQDDTASSPPSRKGKKTRRRVKTEPDPDEKPYGEYQHVYLTDDEKGKLLTLFKQDKRELQFWITDLDEFLEEHDEYQFGMSAKAYKSHYLTIRGSRRRWPWKYQNYVKAQTPQRYTQERQYNRVPHAVQETKLPPEQQHRMTGYVAGIGGAQ